MSVFSFLVSLLFPLLAFAPTASAMDRVTILSWEAFISPRVIKILRNSEGLDVKLVEFSTADEREALLKTRSREFDIVIADTVWMPKFRKQGLIADIDEKRVPALKVMQQKWKVDTSYSVPYMWGYTGIAWRTDKVAAPITSYAQLLALAKSNPGKVSLLDDAHEALRAMQFASGAKSGALRTPADVATAAKSLAPHEKYLRFETPSLDEKSAWLDGSLIAGQAYNGDIAYMRDKLHAPLGFAVPSPGCLVWQERMGILASSKNKDAAYRFLDLITSLKYAARNSMDVRFAPANPMAMAGLSEEFIADPVVKPTFEGIEGCYLYAPLDAATEAAVGKVKLKGVSGH